MQVLVSADSSVQAGAELIRQVETEIGAVLSRFGDQVRRVEVHLSDEAGAKSGGADKRCVLAARTAGQQRVAVSHQAANLGEACSGAARKLRTLLDRRLGRLDDHKGGDTIRQPR